MMTLDEAKAMLPDIQQTHGLASERWGESFHIETGRAEICARDRGVDTPIMHILPACSYDDRRLAINAPRYIKALLVMLHEAFRVIRKLQREVEELKQKRTPDHARDCGILCNDVRFGLFLVDRYQLHPPANKASVEGYVRGKLKIQSRKELNTDPAAAQRWIKLRAEFYSWRRHG